MSELPGPPRAQRLHDLLLSALIVLRPLVWGGDPTAWDSLAYLMLTAAALLAVAVEGRCGWRSAWRWNWGGLLAGALLLALIPAAARAGDPAAAWGTVGMLAADVALAAYVMQVLPGRTRLAWAALVAGLALVAVVAAVQYGAVLPAMRAALEAGDPELLRLETSHGDLAERLRFGGVFATFTLANTFAAYLLLTLPPLLAALLVPANQRGPRTAGALVAALAAAALLATGSKGAYLCLAAAAALLALGRLRGWRRLLPPAAVLLALAAVLAVPALRAGLGLSAQVRLGYWQGALALIGEAPLLGHGLGGFAAASPRAMPLWAEPTRYVHNELLEAWCDGGVLAAALLAALLVRLVGSAGTDPAGAPAAAGQPARAPAAALALLPGLLLFGALGMLASNVSWWPGAGSDSGWLTWMLLVGALGAGALIAAERLPLPPPWAWRLGILALALHCLIDFDLHSPGVRGCLVIAACLAGTPAHSLAITPARRLAATLAAAGLLAALAYGVRRAGELSLGELLAAEVQEVQAATAAPAPPLAPSAVGRAELARTALADLLGAVPAPGARMPPPSALIAAALERIAELSRRWPRANALALTGLALQPPGAERLERGRELRALLPADAALRDLASQDLAALGRYEEAVAAERAAVALAPANLARRLALATLLERAAAHDPAHAAALQAEAERQRTTVAELKAVVHPRNLP